MVSVMPWVVKIGGSLYDSEYLLKWLNTLSGCDAQRIIIVPGGGPFADQARRAYQRHGLDQRLAHNIAVLGMQQFGYVLASLCPCLCPADSKETIYACWRRARTVVWEPYEMVRRYCKLERSWKVTSDSLAAWLASYLSASRLLLVKSAEAVRVEADADKLARQGCIDPALPEILSGMNIPVHFMHKSQVKGLDRLLNDPP